MNVKITNRLVASQTPSDKVIFYWDNELRGFGLKITPAGSKIYVVQYRMGGRSSKTQRYTIGRHDSPWNAREAREEAKRILLKVQSNIDPRQEEIKQQRDEMELRFDVYVQKFINMYMHRNWRENTIKTHESNFRRWIVPHLGKMTINRIERKDITVVFDNLPPNSPALPRNLFNLVRRLFSWAVERGDIQYSPMHGLKAPAAPESRNRVLSDIEILRIASLSIDLGPIWAGFIHMLILTGQRKNEVAKMTWDEVDRSQKVWKLPPARVKNGRMHNVPLNELAMGTLDSMANGAEWPDSGYIFTHNKRTPISGFSKVKKRLDTILDDFYPNEFQAWCFHDIRRTLITNMQKLGVRFEVMEAILNHVSAAQTGVAAVYMRYDWATEKKAALQEWADYLLVKLDEYPNSKDTN